MTNEAPQPLLYIGTYTEPIRFGTGQILQGQGRGIHILRLDPDAATLAEVDVAAGVRNPSFLTFSGDGRFVYAVNEMKEYEGVFGGAVSSFARDAATGRLTPLNTVPTHGTDPCHLMVDRSGKYVLIANFASGHVTVVPIRPDGSLAPASQVIEHAGSSVDPARQSGPHPHAIEMNEAGDLVFVPDLGLDRIVVYRFDAATGTLTPHDPPFASAEPGQGPRQIVVHPSEDHAYVVNELGSTVTAYSYDRAKGAFTPRHTVPTLPQDFSGHSSCAELQIADSGRFLYASNRGHDSIAMFAIAPGSGDLSPLGHVSTGGAIPRHFDISPCGRFLAAANQDTGNIVLFRIDSATGALTPTGSEVKVGTPVCVRFL